MLTPNAPHTPLQATAEYTDRYRSVEPAGRRIFAAMVSSVDDYVGDVVAELRAQGLEENTLIVFFSDNGLHQVPFAGYLLERSAEWIETVPSRGRHPRTVYLQLACRPALRENIRTSGDLSGPLRHVCGCGRLRRNHGGQREPVAVSARPVQRSAPRIPLLASQTDHGHPLGQVEAMEGQQDR